MASKIKKLIRKIRKNFLGKNKKVALVLGSGGSRGLSHIGVLKQLKKHQIPVDMIVGCSIGSVVGSIYALKQDPTYLEEISEKLGKKTTLKFFSIGNIAKSLLKQDKIKDLLHDILGEATFKDVKIPISIVATEFNSGEPVTLQSGKLLDCVMASSAIPGVYPPYKIGKHLYIDGGVINPTPIDIAANNGADIIIAIDLSAKPQTHIAKPSLLECLSRTYEVNMFHLTQLRLRTINEFQNKTRVFLVQPNVKGNIDYYKAKEYIKAGEESIEPCIEGIKKELRHKKSIFTK